MSNLTGRPIYQKGMKPEKVPAIRNASRDETCTLAIPGVCCRDPKRVVGCHLRFFASAGAAQKPDDVLIVDACDCCHAILDSRDKWAEAQVGWDDVLRAFCQTLLRRRASGLIHLGVKQ